MIPDSVMKRYLAGKINGNQLELALDMRLQPRWVLEGVAAGRYARPDAIEELYHVQCEVDAWGLGRLSLSQRWDGRVPVTLLGVDMSPLFEPPTAV